MATYTKKCTAVGGFSYAGNFTLYVELTEVNVSTANNTSAVKYNIYCKSSGSGSISSEHLKKFVINGQTIINSKVHVGVSSPNANIKIASGTTSAIAHTSDGSKSISWSAQIKGSTYGVSASNSGTFTLTKIARKPVLKITSITNVALTSMKVNYSVSGSNFYHIEYSINNGAWVRTSGYPTISISGLKPNTTYAVRVRGVSQDNAIYGDPSNSVSAKTLDIAKISSAPSFEHGNNASITIVNPASIGSLSLKMTVGGTTIFTRTVKTGTNTISFSDTELDNIYKKYGNANSVTATYVLTGSGYTHQVSCTVTLKGNQKTIKYKTGGTWRRGKVWIKISGVWRKAVAWYKVNGTWRRSI